MENQEEIFTEDELANMIMALNSQKTKLLKDIEKGINVDDNNNSFRLAYTSIAKMKNILRSK